MLINKQTIINSLTMLVLLAGFGTYADSLGTAEKLPVYRRLPRPYFCHQMVAVGDCLYIIGGHGSGKRLADVWMTKVEKNGDISAWQKQPALPPGKAGFQYHTAVAGKNAIYVLGGNYLDEDRKGGTSDQVWFATVGADGKLADWQQTSSLPAARKCGEALVNGNRIYYLGGQYNREVFAADINKDGSLGKWSTIAKLPTNLYDMAAFIDGKYFYVIGGSILIERQSDRAFRCKVNPDGTLGKFRRTESLPVPLGNFCFVKDGKELFLLGGTDKNGIIYKTRIDQDGHLQEWQKIGTLPDKELQSFQVVKVGDYLFLTGGIIIGKPNQVLRSVYRIPVIKENK